MKMYRLIWALLLFQACTNPTTKQLSVINLLKIDETDMFSDSTFFSQLKSMYVTNGHIFLSDYKRNQVLEITPMNTVINTIGNQGRGPGELLGTSSLYVKNDTIYILSEFQQRFELFYKSQYVKGYQPNDRLDGQLRFSVINSNIVYSPESDKHSMAFFDTKKHSSVHFGNKSKLESRYAGRHVWTDNNYIYSISKTRPIIERYSLKGDFVDQYDYGNIEIIAQITQYIDAHPVAENSFYQLIADVYLHQNKLYLLITNFNSIRTTCKTILTIDVKKMEATELYILNENDSWFGPFCIKDNDLYAFEYKKACIMKFQLP